MALYTTCEGSYLHNFYSFQDNDLTLAESKNVGGACA